MKLRVVVAGVTAREVRDLLAPAADRSALLLTLRDALDPCEDLVATIRNPGPARRAKVAEPQARYADVTPETLPRAVAELEKEMFRHAEQLEFEEAARVRDEIHRLKEQVLMSA